MPIRPFRPEDAPALARIFHAAVHQVAALHYSTEQVNAWAPAVAEAQRFVDRGSDGRILLVAADESDRPLAYGDVERDGHIDHLYCRPDVAGTGVASALYDRLEAAARESGIGRLHVEASEPARRFFLRKGFRLLRRRDFTLGGVAIHYFAMEKRLEA
ncbi:MAG TPA: GNAT family N-acetyltransferase [Allosphingosinicella sp.]|jgi:putative acetyltransferase